MRLDTICLTFHMEWGEEEKFKKILCSYDQGVIDWDMESNYQVYDRDAGTHYVILYDVYFEDMEDAIKFKKEIEEQFK